MLDTGNVLGLLIIVIFCVFAISKIMGGRKVKKNVDVPRAAEPAGNSAVVAAIIAAVNNYRNENSQ